MTNTFISGIHISYQRQFDLIAKLLINNQDIVACQTRYDAQIIHAKMNNL